MDQYRLMHSGYQVQKNITLGFSVPAINLSKAATKKLKWIEHYHKHKNASLTCRYYGISRKTLYKWLKRYHPKQLHSLEEKSRRPINYRQSKKLREYGRIIRIIREQRPTWSKYKIGSFIRQGGAIISNTTVGDILRKKGLIDKQASKKRRRICKRNLGKIRIKDILIAINKPGALVQMDTKEYNSYGDRKYIQFTAIDCFSRKRKLRGYCSKTANNGKDFLLQAIHSFPFKIETIVTDNGSEFMGAFDRECRKLKIKHCWTEPCSPNQNAYVESSHSIDQKEFYETTLIPSGINGFNTALAKWEKDYNAIRPHGSLNFLSPDKFLQSVRMKS